MNTKPAAMSTEDAAATVARLFDWKPPEGVSVTVSSSIRPDMPGQRVVNVVMSATEEHCCVINVSEVPGPDVIETLTEAAQLLLDEAWDQPACSGLVPPDGPLNLRATGHPVYDTSKFGRDM